MTSDARAILGLEPKTQEIKSHGPKPSKKKPPGAQSNLSKELATLIGERIPSVAIQAPEHYKKKFTVTRNAQAWEWKEFENPARKDGLKLRHWVKKPVHAATPGTPAEAKNEADGYYFAKYDHKVSVPEYTEAQYEQHLKSNDWSKEETDYLFSLVRDYDLRWILIDDRYDFQPTAPIPSEDLQSSLVVAAKPRTMEDMKARYYSVAAKTITLTHPQAQMTEAEFEAHDRMTKYDPEREKRRKDIAAGLMSRQPEEIKEEEILLAELRRITLNEEKFLEDRKELYSRLDYPIAQINTAVYETAQGLQTLAQGLMTNDRNKKRKSLADASSPAQAASTPTTARDARKDVPTSATTDKRKGPPPQPIRNLTAEEEKKFGVSTHERLNSGVSFRSGRVDKLILAKSQIQSAKLQDAIKELSIPLRPRMPTIAVCAEYEKLISSIHLLLDARKIGDKVNNEIKIVKAQKGIDQEDDDKEDTKAEDDADADGEVDDTGEQVADKKDESDAEEDANESKVEDHDDAEGEEDEEPTKASIESDNEDADEMILPGDENDEEDAGSVVSPESPPADDDDDDDDEEEEAEAERPSSSRASIARSTKSTRSTAAATPVTKHKRSASAMSVSESEKSTGGTRASKRARKQT